MSKRICLLVLEIINKIIKTTKIVKDVDLFQMGQNWGIQGELRLFYLEKR